MDFEKFVQDYLHYCMGFGEANAASIAKAGRPYLEYVTEACGGTREPYLLGTFLLQKAARTSGLSMSEVQSRSPAAPATTDQSWLLDTLPSLGRVVLMVGANPHVYRQLRRRLPAGAQLFVQDPDLQRLRKPWAGSLGRGGITALFFRGGIERFFRELPIVPSAVLIEFGAANEGQGVLIDQLRSRVADETSILIYGQGVESNLEPGEVVRRGFSRPRSRALARGHRRTASLRRGKGSRGAAVSPRRRKAREGIVRNRQIRCERKSFAGDALTRREPSRPVAVREGPPIVALDHAGRLALAPRLNCDAILQPGCVH